MTPTIKEIRGGTDADFIARIVENPADDTPRLVYADWLDDHAGAVECDRCIGGYISLGGPQTREQWDPCPDCTGTGRVPDGNAERAEFIRVQCELVKLESAVLAERANAVMGGCCDRFADCKPCNCLNTPEMDALRRRERELWGDPNDRAKMLGLPPGWLATIIPSILNRLSSGWAGIVLVRRGFVAEVRAPLAMLFGERCRRCDGRGHHGVRAGSVAPPCQTCGGFGTTPGVAAGLFAAHPVERVTPTDAVIHPSGGNDTYYVGGLGQFPGEYWSRLENLPSRRAALDALSAACVARGRELVGLPKL